MAIDFLQHMLLNDALPLCNICEKVIGLHSAIGLRTQESSG